MIHIKPLTSLRFFAALLVLVFHFGSKTFPFTLPIIREFIKEGSIAVSFFFFLSGTVLTIKYFDKTTILFKDFILKRLARLYPIYFVSFIFTLVLCMLFRGAFPKGGSIILQLLGLHAWLPGLSLQINFPAWSISVELFFYLLFPFIPRLFKYIGQFNSILLVILIWLFSVLQFYFSPSLIGNSTIESQEFILYFPLWHLNVFLVGVLCGKYILNHHEGLGTQVVIPRIMFGLGIVLFVLFYLLPNPYVQLAHNGPLAPVFFLIIAGLSLDRSWLTRLLSAKWLELLGESSYTMYIIQWPLMVVFMQLKGVQDLELQGYDFGIYILALTGLSIFLHYYFEKPIRMIFLKRFITREQ